MVHHQSMMNTLAIHCSSHQTSVAFGCKEGYQHCALDTHNPNSTVLLKLLDGVCPEPSVVERLAVDLGPGSFMSLRVGMAAVKAIASIRQLAIHTIDSLALLSWAYVMETRPTTTIQLTSIIDAKRQEWYLGRYLYQPNNIQLINPIGLVKPSQVKFATSDILLSQNLTTANHYGADLKHSTSYDLADSNLAQVLLELVIHQSQYPNAFHGVTDATSLQPLYIRNQVADKPPSAST